MKRVNVPKPKAPTGAAAIDVARHKDGFVDAAAQITALVARMARGQEVLSRMPTDHPDRRQREALWHDLASRLHEALRHAYARYALIRIAVGWEDAQALWDSVMPPRCDLDAIGIGEMVRYWRGRTEPPHWITHEETRFIRRVEWPPEGCYPDDDVLNQRLQDMYSTPPF